ncbi:MAG: ABC transporter substrate-binding protein [Chloroflexi bacterium]|nr:ABC transporter substrate-binding protein [Chloroflexota bacterium]
MGTHLKRHGYSRPAALGVALIMVVAACAPQAPAAPPVVSSSPTPAAAKAPAPQQAVAPRYGGTLKTLMGCIVGNFDPIYTGTCDSIMNWPVYNAVVEKNTRPGQLDEFVPALAESWSVSPQGTEYTFQLRKDVKWHDGSPFTAADVEYTFDAIFKPPQGMASSHKARLSTVTGVQSAGDYTVTIKTSAPTAALIETLSTIKIAPKHVHQGKRPFKSTALGTGPFALEMFRADQSGFLLRKNPAYFVKGLPYLDAIDYITIRDDKAREAVLRAGRADASTIDITDGGVQALKEHPRIKLLVFPKLQYAALWFRFGLGKPWEDVKVRRAVSLAIDRDALIKAAWPGENPAAFVLPGPWALPQTEVSAYPGFGKDAKANLAEAKRLLKEAGYPDGFSVEMVYGTTIRWSDSAETIQQMLKEVGIKVNLRGVDNATAEALTRGGTFEFTHRPNVPTLMDPTDILSAYVTGAAQISHKYSNPKVDDLYKKAGTTLDTAARKATVNQLERELFNELPVIPLVLRNGNQAHWDYVKGWETYGLWFHPVWRLERVWMDESLR